MTLTGLVLSDIAASVTTPVQAAPVELANATLNATANATGVLGGVFNAGMSGTSLAIIGAGIAVGAAGLASAIGAGIVGAAGAKTVSEDPKRFSTSLLFQALPQTQGIYGFLIAILILLGAGVIGGTGNISVAQGLGALGAGLAVGLAAISALGQGIAAAGGIGAVGQDKKMFGKSILFSVLPETQALYGFIISILILIGVGLFGAARGEISMVTGWAAVGAGLAAGIAGISAIGQGIAAAGGIGATARDDKMFGKGILFSVLPETQALYGFLIAVLLLVGGGVMGAAKAGLDTAVGVIALGAGLAVGISAISAIGQGVSAAAGIGAVTEKKSMFGKAIIFSIIPETQALMGFLIAILILIGAGVIGTLKAGLSLPVGLVAIGSGLAVGLAAVSAVGQGTVITSGIAAVTKDQKMFGKSLLFGVLPQTQALYGFLVAILLLIGGGIIGATKTGLTSAAGLVAIGSGLAVGFGAVSAIGQGIAAAGGIGAVSQDKKMFGKGILFSVLPETQALYGFLIAILLLVGGGLVGAVKGGLSVPIGIVAIAAGFAAGVAAVSAIGQGVSASAGIASVTEKKSMFGKAIIFSIIPETQALMGFLIAVLLLIGVGLIGTAKAGVTVAMGIVAMGAALAVGLAAVSAVGQGTVITSSIAAVTRDAKMFGKSLLFSVLPQTQALYGFLIAILLLIGGGLIGSLKEGLTAAAGLVAVGSGLAVGLAAVSALGQGYASAPGIAAVTENKKLFGKALLFGVLPQTQALYGFLVAILLLIGGGLAGAVRPGLTIPVGMVAVGAGFAAGLAAFSAVGQGLTAGSGMNVVAGNNRLFGKAILFSVLPETQALYGFLVAILLLVGAGLIGSLQAALEVPAALIAIGAGLSIGIAGLSAIGQGIAASSGVGSVAEKEKMFGKSILFSVLPETQALYGIIIAILLMTGVGLMGALKTGVTLVQGLGGVGIGLTMGFAAISAIGQGIAAAGSVGGALRSDKSMGKGLVLSVIPETYAIFGLLISILMLLGLNLI